MTFREDTTDIQWSPAGPGERDPQLVGGILASLALLGNGQASDLLPGVQAAGQVPNPPQESQ